MLIRFHTTPFCVFSDVLFGVLKVVTVYLCLVMSYCLGSGCERPDVNVHNTLNNEGAAQHESVY